MDEKFAGNAGPPRDLSDIFMIVAGEIQTLHRERKRQKIVSFLQSKKEKRKKSDMRAVRVCLCWSMRLCVCCFCVCLLGNRRRKRESTDEEELRKRESVVLLLQGFCCRKRRVFFSLSLIQIFTSTNFLIIPLLFPSTVNVYLLQLSLLDFAVHQTP